MRRSKERRSLVLRTSRRPSRHRGYQPTVLFALASFSFFLRATMTLAKFSRQAISVSSVAQNQMSLSSGVAMILQPNHADGQGVVKSAVQPAAVQVDVEREVIDRHLRNAMKMATLIWS